MTQPPTRHVYIKKLKTNDLMPIIEAWLSDQGFHVSTVANKVQGARATIRLAVLLEDYAQGCSIRMSGPPEQMQSLKTYLDTVPTTDSQWIVCDYCDTKYSTNDNKCPNCGAHRKNT